MTRRLRGLAIPSFVYGLYKPPMRSTWRRYQWAQLAYRSILRRHASATGHFCAPPEHTSAETARAGRTLIGIIRYASELHLRAYELTEAQIATWISLDAQTPAYIIQLQIMHVREYWRFVHDPDGAALLQLRNLSSESYRGMQQRLSHPRGLEALAVRLLDVSHARLRDARDAALICLLANDAPLRIVRHIRIEEIVWTSTAVIVRDAREPWHSITLTTRSDRLDPVRALAHWLAVRNAPCGWLFTRIDRYGNVYDEPLAMCGPRFIIKQRARDVGLQLTAKSFTDFFRNGYTVFPDGTRIRTDLGPPRRLRHPQCPWTTRVRGLRYALTGIASPFTEQGHGMLWRPEPWTRHHWRTSAYHTVLKAHLMRRERPLGEKWDDSWPRPYALLSLVRWTRTQGRAPYELHATDIQNWLSEIAPHISNRYRSAYLWFARRYCAQVLGENLARNVSRHGPQHVYEVRGVTDKIKPMLSLSSKSDCAAARNNAIVVLRASGVPSNAIRRTRFSETFASTLPLQFGDVMSERCGQTIYKIYPTEADNESFDSVAAVVKWLHLRPRGSQWLFCRLEERKGDAPLSLSTIKAIWKHHSSGLRFSQTARRMALKRGLIKKLT